MPGRPHLLDGVGQLVREQPLPGWLRRRKTAIVERNVLPDRVRASSDEPSALRRPGVGMHPNKAEVMPEAGLEERARIRIERPPRSVHDLLHDPRDVLFPPKPRPARRQSSNSYLYQLAQYVITLVVSSVEDLEDKSLPPGDDAPPGFDEPGEDADESEATEVGSIPP